MLTLLHSKHQHTWHVGGKFVHAQIVMIRTNPLTTAQPSCKWQNIANVWLGVGPEYTTQILIFTQSTLGSSCTYMNTTTTQEMHMEY